MCTNTRSSGISRHPKIAHTEKWLVYNLSSLCRSLSLALLVKIVESPTWICIFYNLTKPQHNAHNTQWINKWNVNLLCVFFFYSVDIRTVCLFLLLSCSLWLFRRAFVIFNWPNPMMSVCNLEWKSFRRVCVCARLWCCVRWCMGTQKRKKIFKNE